MPLPGLRDKDVDILRSTFRHFSFVQEVRVFGSRANGIARRSSDLDLAISSPEATPAEWAELCDALENTPIIYALDHWLPNRYERGSSPRGLSRGSEFRLRSLRR